MHLSSRQKKIGLPLFTLIVLLATAWQFGWLDQEPRHNGKTVTEWLDGLELYRHVEHISGGYTDLRSPESLASDPALRAISAIGTRAVPVLMRRIAEPAGFPPETPVSARFKLWLAWQWYRLRGGNTPRPPAGNWTPAQQARKLAAGFALLALGTNAHAGFSCFAAAYAKAPQFASSWGGDVAGMPVGFSPSQAVRAAVTALPQRREEIVAEALAGLRHTNAVWRQVSLECARVFPEELLKQKQLLVSLTRDTNALVQETALGALIMIVQEPSLTNLMSISEIRQVAQAVVDAPGNSPRVRALAATVVRLGDLADARAAK